MKILEDGTIRIEYKNYDTGEYLYKDISKEFLRNQRDNKNLMFYVKNDVIDKEFKNGFTDVARCKFLRGLKTCAVDVTQYGDIDNFCTLSMKLED